jgi:hypothetical protein
MTETALMLGENDGVTLGFSFPESTRAQGSVQRAAFGLGQLERSVDELGDVGEHDFPRSGIGIYFSGWRPGARGRNDNGLRFAKRKRVAPRRAGAE